MEPLKSDSATFKTISYPVPAPKNRSTISCVRTDNSSIPQMPKLVPVNEPKPPIESPQPQQQSVLKKTVAATTSLAAGGAACGPQNVIKLIKTVHGPNGNPIKKIVSLKIKGSSPSSVQTKVPVSLLPITIHEKTQPAMFKITGVPPLPLRKIAPKEAPINQTTPKATGSMEFNHNMKLTKDVTMTTKIVPKQQTLLIKQAQQQPQTIKTQPKEPFAGFPLSPTLTSAWPTATSDVINTLVASKTLEIKTVTMESKVTASAKPFNSKPKVTITSTTSSVALPVVISKSLDSRPELLVDAPASAPVIITAITDSVAVDTETTQKLPMKNAESIDNDSSVLFKQSPGAPKMINLLISNGKLSDPNGPIRLISGNLPKKSETDSIEDQIKESTPESHNQPIEILQVQTMETDTPAHEAEIAEQSVPTTKNIEETLVAISDEKPIKPKQQSLLRNKTIDLLQRSPRTKRSKSLTAVAKREKNYRGRSLSMSLERDESKQGHVLTSNISKPSSKTPSEAQVTKLLCPEKIASSNDSLATTPPEGAKKPLIEILMNSSDEELDEMSEKSKHDIDVSTKIEDDMKHEVKSITPEKLTENAIHNILDWEDGIGFLKDSKLQFRLNEFGFFEIFKIDEELQTPIYEREFKSQKTLDYRNTSLCKGCKCTGASIDFWKPDFCSTECFKRFNERKSNGTTNPINVKKYANRKRHTDEMESDALPQKQIQRMPSSALRESHLDAPYDLFAKPFPYSSNMFSVGMKLEAIDPEHNSLFCVCTIVEKKGYRLRLHFDGYSKFYDFWINADSTNIFPPGWCSKTNRMLQPPLGVSPLSFNWPKYLTQTKGIPAPRNLFQHLNKKFARHGFKVGMKIEADDVRNSMKVCVATVADILDSRLLIVFDGWDDRYSYWTDVNSPYIHPVNWHKTNGFSIVPPPDYEDTFCWPTYLVQTKSVPANEHLFRTRNPIGFKSGMRLEVVDKRNPSLIRPASVIMVNEYEVKVLFDNWPKEYAFWTEDDSPDLHPRGWCAFTNHELEPPPGQESAPSRYCKFQGCRGIGNALHPDLNVHANILSCPYAPENWSKDLDKTGRLRTTRKFNNSLLSMLPDQQETVPINKRKSDPLMRPPINAKRAKHQIEPQSLLPKSLSSAPVITGGMSLLKTEKSETDVDTCVNVARHLLCDYGPRLHQAYTLWKQNSECLSVNLAENKSYKKSPLDWNVNEVSEYIAKLPRCQTLAHEFQRQDIDGAAFLAMRQTDLTDIMKIKLGPAIKIYNQIIQLREDVAMRFTNNTSRIC